MDPEKAQTPRMILEMEKERTNAGIQSKFVQYLKHIQLLESEIVSLSNSIVQTYDSMVEWNQKKPLTDYDQMLKHNMMQELYKQLETYIKSCSNKKTEILQMLLVLQNYAEQYLKNARSNLFYNKEQLISLEKRAQTNSFKSVIFPKEILRNASTSPKSRRMSDAYIQKRF